MTIEFFVEGTSHEGLLSILQDEDAHLRIDEDGVTTEWRVRGHSHSYQSRAGEEPNEFQHTIELAEFEDLTPTSLKIGPFELQPYRYEERFEDAALTASARVRVDRHTFESLRDFMFSSTEYFEVVREGISSEVRHMRFGTVLWSGASNEFKYELTLVDRLYDEQQEGNADFLFHPQLSSVELWLATQIELTDRLVQVLTAKGIITESEAVSLRSEAQARRRIRRMDFYRMKDIDDQRQGAGPPDV